MYLGNNFDLPGVNFIFHKTDITFLQYQSNFSENSNTKILLLNYSKKGDIINYIDTFIKKLITLYLGH